MLLLKILNHALFSNPNFIKVINALALNTLDLTLGPDGSHTHTGNSDTVLGFVTESYFNPYISTIGLYNNNQELMAVGKLTQPIQSSPTTDTTFLINFDT